MFIIIFQLVLKDGNDHIRDTGVLVNTDILAWNWSLIKVVVRVKYLYLCDYFFSW